MSKEKKELKLISDLESAYRSSYRIALISVLGFFIVTGLCVFLYYMQTKNIIKNKMIVLVSDNSATYLPDKKAHLVGHCTNFHKYFFEIDEFNYQKQLEKAMPLMVNKESKMLLETYASNDWFRTIQTSNISVGLDIDSVYFNAFNDNNKIYELTMRCTQKIRSKNEIQERNLLTNMKCKPVSNSYKNPYGYLIYDFKILDNTNKRRTNLMGETIDQIQ